MLRALFDPGDWLGMRPALDPFSPTLGLEYRPDPAQVKLRIGVGLFVLAVSGVAAYLARADGFLVFVACGFGGFALINLVYGILQSGFEKSLLITGSQVLVKTRTLFSGRREWSEPIANYRGVLMRERQLRENTVGKTVTTKTYHIVELAHPDPQRTVPLFVREWGVPPRDIQEAFARRLNLPALSPDSPGETAQPVEALDRPVARATAPPADPGPPPSGVVVTKTPEAIRIAIGQGRTERTAVKAFWYALPLVFGGLVFLIDPLMGLVVASMAGLFVLVIRGAERLVHGTTANDVPTINVGTDRIWIDRPEPASEAFAATAITDRILRAMGAPQVPDAGAPAQSLPRDSVEQVRVDGYTGRASRTGNPSFHARLVIEGDQGRLVLIQSQFDRGKLEWVRDYLLAVALPR